MLKLTTTSYLHLFNTLNFNIFVHKSRSNARGIQLVYLVLSTVMQMKAKASICPPHSLCAYSYY